MLKSMENKLRNIHVLTMELKPSNSQTLSG